MTLTAGSLELFDIFKELSYKQCEALVERMDLREYAAGSYIISSGSTSSVYFLISGRVRACAYSETGKQIYFEDLFQGAMFGELAAIDGGPRTSDCVCISKCHVASISKSKFLAMLDEFPTVNRAVLVRLVELVRRQLQRVYEYSTYTVNQRIRFELLRLVHETGTECDPVELSSAPTQMELADRVSSHREAVSRELKRLESDGIVCWSRRKRVVLDRKKLAERARIS